MDKYLPTNQMREQEYAKIKQNCRWLSVGGKCASPYIDKVLKDHHRCCAEMCDYWLWRNKLLAFERPDDRFDAG